MLRRLQLLVDLLGQVPSLQNSVLLLLLFGWMMMLKMFGLMMTMMSGFYAHDHFGSDVFF